MHSMMVSKKYVECNDLTLTAQLFKPLNGIVCGRLRLDGRSPLTFTYRPRKAGTLDGINIILLIDSRTQSVTVFVSVCLHVSLAISRDFFIVCHSRTRAATAVCYQVVMLEL